MRPLAVVVVQPGVEGTDLDLYHKYLMTLEGDPACEHHVVAADLLSLGQKHFVRTQHARLKA